MIRIGRAAALLCCIALTGGCRQETPPLHIVLITIDTLRADHCSVYGYERQTTPFLEEFAAQATVFENAYATSSWTAPSMASIFTALPPRSHGVIRGFVFDGKVTGQDYLSDDFTTLAEVLSAHGYQTFGVSTNAHLTAATGFAQGFAGWTELWFDEASVATAAATTFADRLTAADKYFLWVHYFDPHVEYLAREPWYGDYRQQRPDAPEMPINESSKEAGRAWIKDMIDRYDSEINYTDESLRMLFSTLHIDANTLVVVTSDHGEAFGEHRVLTHGHSLFEEEIRVPLIMKVPGQQHARRVESPVSILDIYPTVLDAAGIDRPGRLAGVSLLPATRDAPTSDRPIVSELDRGKVADRTLTWRRWKLYQRESPDRSVSLFDLQNDPAERHDVSAAHRKRVEDLQGRWNRWSGQWAPFNAPNRVAPFGEDELNRLRALGYLPDE